MRCECVSLLWGRSVLVRLRAGMPLRLQNDLRGLRQMLQMLLVRPPPAAGHDETEGVTISVLPVLWKGV